MFLLINVCVKILIVQYTPVFKWKALRNSYNVGAKISSTLIPYPYAINIEISSFCFKEAHLVLSYRFKMYSVDLYLGAFLIIAGFALSLLNLRRLLMKNGRFSNILISENVLLMCIGLVFVSRYVYRMNPFTATMDSLEERMGVNMDEEMDCNFLAALMSYGPIIVPLVNSFLTLLIDNYMHYRMLADAKQEDDENTVQDFREISTGVSVKNVFECLKNNFSYIAIASQWIVPITLALSMYPMEVKEKRLIFNEVHSNDVCMAMVDVTKEMNGSDISTNYTLELRQFLPSYWDTNKNTNYSQDIETIIKNVKEIVKTVENETQTEIGSVSFWNDLKNRTQDDVASISFWRKFENGTIMDEASAPMWKKFRNGTLDDVASASLWTNLLNEKNSSKFRKSKLENSSMKICFIENNKLLLFIFIVCVISYFIPITISTVILTKIHVMDIKRPGIKTYVSRELLYNILFWTPVMFDTFLSILLCSYSMNDMRTSIFNVIANVYQAVKNFMNTTYFKENSVSPV